MLMPEDLSEKIKNANEENFFNICEDLNNKCYCYMMSPSESQDTRCFNCIAINAIMRKMGLKLPKHKKETGLIDSTRIVCVLIAIFAIAVTLALLLKVG